MRRQELKAVKDRSNGTDFELAKHLAEDFQNFCDTDKNGELGRLPHLKECGLELHSLIVSADEGDFFFSFYYSECSNTAECILLSQKEVQKTNCPLGLPDMTVHSIYTSFILSA